MPLPWIFLWVVEHTVPDKVPNKYVQILQNIVSVAALQNDSRTPCPGLREKTTDNSHCVLVDATSGMKGM